MRIRVDHQPLAQSIAVLADTADRIRGLLDELESEAVSYTHLTLPTTPYV